MKLINQHIPTNLSYAKVLKWGKLITITGGTQILVQAVSLLGGILVIRVLSTQEYALYILANTMLGTMTVLADGGITTGVMAEGGKVWEDPNKLGIVLATGLDLRRKFATVILLISLPILLAVLRHHGASWLISVAITSSIIPAFITFLSGSILEIAPKLRQDITALQKIDIGTNISRLLILFLTTILFPFSFVAIAASGIPQIWMNWRIRKISSNYALPNQQPEPEIRTEILKKVKRMLPLSIYYCISSQVTIWLLSIFGSTTSIAQIGAIGRLSLILNIVTMLFNILIVPRFARLPNIKKVLISWYISLHFILAITSMIVIGVVWIFTPQILWILGKKYAGLDSEILILITANCINMIAGSSFALYSHRGLVMHPVAGVSLGIIGIIIGILLTNVSNLRGILLYTLFTAIFSAIANFLYGLIKISNQKIETTYYRI